MGSRFSLGRNRFHRFRQVPGALGVKLLLREPWDALRIQDCANAPRRLCA